MKIEEVNVMGMDMVRWSENGVVADFAMEDDWCTLFSIESVDEGKGFAQKLLKEAKEFYEKEGKRFGGSVALNPTMAHIYEKLGIEEYRSDLI